MSGTGSLFDIFDKQLSEGDTVAKDTKQVMFGKAEEGSFAGADKTKPGVLQGVKKGAIVCDMSTNNPKVSEELEKACVVKCVANVVTRHAGLVYCILTR